MQRAFFIEEGPSKSIVSDNEISARYSGKYSEYEIKPSKNMPGFYIIKDKVKNRDSSDLINSKIQKIIFSDCVKSFNDIEQSVSKFSQIQENIAKGLENIISKKPHKDIFSIEETKEENVSESKKDEEEILDENIDIAEILEDDKLEDINLLECENIISNANDICNENDSFDLDCNDEFINLDELKQLDEECENIDKDCIDMENFSYDDFYDNTNKKPFGKNVIIKAMIVNSIIISVKGYDEKNDKMIFDVSKIPMSVDYRYAISKNTFEIKISGFLNLQDARELMDSFEYSFVSCGKNIKVIINDVLAYDEFF